MQREKNAHGHQKDISMLKMHSRYTLYNSPEHSIPRFLIFWAKVDFYSKNRRDHLPFCQFFQVNIAFAPQRKYHSLSLRKPLFGGGAGVSQACICVLWPTDHPDEVSLNCEL